ncbi:hypothetical protein HK096_008165, partial [Nowakowskiella sp. JEL0078]
MTTALKKKHVYEVSPISCQRVVRCAGGCQMDFKFTGLFALHFCTLYLTLSADPEKGILLDKVKSHWRDHHNMTESIADSFSAYDKAVNCLFSLGYMCCKCDDVFAGTSDSTTVRKHYERNHDEAPKKRKMTDSSDEITGKKASPMLTPPPSPEMNATQNSICKMPWAFKLPDLVAEALGYALFLKGKDFEIKCTCKSTHRNRVHINDMSLAKKLEDIAEPLFTQPEEIGNCLLLLNELLDTKSIVIITKKAEETSNWISSIGVVVPSNGDGSESGVHTPSSTRSGNSPQVESPTFEISSFQSSDVQMTDYMPSPDSPKDQPTQVLSSNKSIAVFDTPSVSFADAVISDKIKEMCTLIEHEAFTLNIPTKNIVDHISIDTSPGKNTRKSEISIIQNTTNDTGVSDSKWDLDNNVELSLFLASDIDVLDPGWNLDDNPQLSSNMKTIMDVSETSLFLDDTFKIKETASRDENVNLMQNRNLEKNPDFAQNYALDTPLVSQISSRTVNFDFMQALDLGESFKFMQNTGQDNSLKQNVEEDNNHQNQQISGRNFHDLVDKINLEQIETPEQDMQKLSSDLIHDLHIPYLNLGNSYLDHSPFLDDTFKIKETASRDEKNLEKNNDFAQNYSPDMSLVSQNLSRTVIDFMQSLDLVESFKLRDSILKRNVEEEFDCLEQKNLVLGEEHPSTLNLLNNLDGLYDNQAKYVKAEPLFIGCSFKKISILGAKHLYTPTSLNNLAGLYRSQGKYEKAEPLYIDSLEKRRRVLGEEHPSTLTSLNNLAGLYCSQG